MPPVDPGIESESVDEVVWFMTKEQEAASAQLRFKWKPGVAGAVSKLEAFFAGGIPGMNRHGKCRWRGLP